MGTGERAAREHEQRAEQHPLRPEVSVRAAEEPDTDRDDVHERVLQCQRLPTRIAELDRRQLRGWQLSEDVAELSLGSRGVGLVEPFLEFLEREPSRLVV